MATGAVVKESTIKSSTQKEWQKNWGWIFAMGIGLMLLGFLAMSAPWVTTLAITTVVGALFVVAGFGNFIQIFKAKGFGNSLGYLILSGLYIVAGAFLLISPLRGAVALTLILAWFFVLGGILKCLMAVEVRKQYRGWGFMLFAGFVNVGFGWIILSGMPDTAAWMIGLFVGIDLVFQGWTATSTAFYLKGTKTAIA